MWGQMGRKGGSPRPCKRLPGSSPRVCLSLEWLLHRGEVAWSRVSGTLGAQGLGAGGVFMVRLPARTQCRNILKEAAVMKAIGGGEINVPLKFWIEATPFAKMDRQLFTGRRLK